MYAARSTGDGSRTGHWLTGFIGFVGEMGQVNKGRLQDDPSAFEAGSGQLHDPRRSGPWKEEIISEMTATDLVKITLVLKRWTWFASR
jgi:hypothetical protein